jgi:ABC-type spermidine/putrescine transport system permease subunit II
MKRSIAVTISAIIALLGSIFCVGSGALGALAIFAERGRLPGGAASTATALFGMLVLVIPGIWGIITGTGLLLLKGWARISIIIFASLLALSAFGAPMMLLIPFPPTPGADASSFGASASAWPSFIFFWRPLGFGG